MKKTILRKRSTTNKSETLNLRQIIPLVGLALLSALIAACTSSPTVAPSTAVPPTAPPPTVTPEPEKFDPWVKGEITSPALADNLVGDSATKPYLVFLPPSYPEGNKRYPVIYALPGWTKNETHIKRMGSDLDKMIASGDAPEMIVVFANSSNAFRGSWWPISSSPTVGDYRTYITHDLVNHIDANFRTIPQRDSRGITGCGGNSGSGALNLAFADPDIFSVAVSMDGIFDYENDPLWESARRQFRGEPKDFAELRRLPWQIRTRFAIAAGAVSNPDKPPFYLDMPFAMVDGKAQIVPEVAEQMNASDTVDLLPAYLEQSIRLNAIMLQHGSKSRNVIPIASSRAFDELLTQEGIEHEYVEIDAGACGEGVYSYEHVIQFMAKNLSFEMSE
jgi:S-formylglutathione hydrolase FrmB